MTEKRRSILSMLAHVTNPEASEVITAALVEIDRLEAERDGYRRGLALVQGEADPDWDLKFAALLIENATLAREVERLREAAGLEG